MLPSAFSTRELSSCSGGSLDLNLIENVWRLLKSRVQNRFPHVKGELIRYIKEEWEKIDLRDTQKYCTSIRERYQAVQQAGGSYTLF
jgi:hypothetical protein